MATATLVPTTPDPAATIRPPREAPPDHAPGVGLGPPRRRRSSAAGRSSTSPRRCGSCGPRRRSSPARSPRAAPACWPRSRRWGRRPPSAAAPARALPDATARPALLHPLRPPRPLGPSRFACEEGTTMASTNAVRTSSAAVSSVPTTPAISLPASTVVPFCAARGRSPGTAPAASAARCAGTSLRACVAPGAR